MKCTVCILFIINLTYSLPIDNCHESEDGSKFYIEPAIKYNWFEALSECTRKNMSLIAIDSSAKHQQIDNLLKSFYFSPPFFWIGGHDNLNNLRFEWVSTGKPISFTNWGPYQPDNSSKDEHCLILLSDFQWHDNTCSNKRGYICEANHLVRNACHRTPHSEVNSTQLDIRIFGSLRWVS